MAVEYSLEVVKRTETGKNAVRRLRREGFVPGVFYNKQGNNIPLKVPYSTLERVYLRAHKSNIVELRVQDGAQQETHPVLIWDLLEHPVKNLILHADFMGVDLKTEMDMDVSIQVTGTAKGEDEGGIVSLYRDMITVTCLPTAIPDQIEIDVSELGINDSINVEDLVLPEGVKLKDVDENFAVVGVMPPEASVEEEEAAEEGEEGGAGETGGEAGEAGEGDSGEEESE